jgi:hypothetical protein
MRARSLITPIAACAASFGAAAGATAALSTGTGGRAAATSTAKTITTTVTYAKAPKGLRGAAGRTGATGPRGDRGAARIVASPVTINWQNGRWQNRATASFVAPGIGKGTITCTPNIEHVTDSGAQYIEFTPDDQAADTTMASVRTDDRPFTYFQNDDPYGAAGHPIDVKFAHDELHTGPTFREGFNLKAFSPTYRAQGSMFGIISQRGKRGAVGGPAAAKPTTFRLSWHWRFDDGNPRCYVAGTFYTEAT